MNYNEYNLSNDVIFMSAYCKKSISTIGESFVLDGTILSSNCLQLFVNLYAYASGMISKIKFTYNDNLWLSLLSSRRIKLGLDKDFISSGCYSLHNDSFDKELESGFSLLHNLANQQDKFRTSITHMNNMIIQESSYTTRITELEVQNQVLEEQLQEEKQKNMKRILAKDIKKYHTCLNHDQYRFAKKLKGENQDELKNLLPEDKRTLCFVVSYFNDMKNGIFDDTSTDDEELNNL